MNSSADFPKRNTKRHRSQLNKSRRLEWPPEGLGQEALNNPVHKKYDDVHARNKLVMTFLEQSNKSEEWNKKYVYATMFLLGYGAYGSVFEVATRLYHSKSNMDQKRFVYHSDFLAKYASHRKLKVDEFDKLKDKNRNERLFDTVAIKYESLEQSQLEDGITRFYLFLRREFLVLDAIWTRFSKQLVGFPVVFDFGYIGDRLQYSVNPKYKNIFTYLNLQGEEVKFFADTSNRNLNGVTKLSYLTLELLGPSVDDYRSYFEPWYARSQTRPFFQAPTVFKIADQVLCRLYTLHKAGFVHHDLKPDNLAVGLGQAMNTIYLIDFGFAKQISDSAVHEWMGSRKYIAVDTYHNEKPNYAQDIESWFYLVTSLLFDSLPWSDEVIQPLLDPCAEEGAKWELVASIKKTWWGESNLAPTLESTLQGMAALHQTDLPDIQQIMQQLHKKVRDLREHLRQIQDSKMLNAELSNSNSVASRGYMSIRKVLLQIFDLPNITKNPKLGDNEFHTYQQARMIKKLKPYKWDPNNFEWEWDRNHERMTSEQDGFIGAKDGVYAMDVYAPEADTRLSQTHNTANVRCQLNSLASYLNYEARGMRTRLANAPVPPRPAQPPLATNGRLERPDEVSYVYDATSNTLVPKLYDNRGRRLREQQQQQLRQQLCRPKSFDSRTRVSDENTDTALWQLTHPNCLM